MKRILDFVLKYERRDAFSYCSYSCLLVSNRSHLQKHARDFSYCTKSLFPGWYIHCTWKPTWIWKIPARYFNLQSPNLAFKVHVHKQLWFVVSIFEPFSEKKTIQQGRHAQLFIIRFCNPSHASLEVWLSNIFWIVGKQWICTSWLPWKQTVIKNSAFF